MIRSLAFPVAVLLAIPAGTLPSAESSETRRSPADHTECARFLNNFDSTPENKRGYRIQDYGSLSNDRLRYLPFRLASDGTVSPFPDTNTSCDPASGACTYTYLSPPLDDLEDIDDKDRVNALVTADHPRLVHTEVVVQRDPNGNIMEIFEGLPLNHHKPTTERPYNAINGTRTVFEVRNDTCVPMRKWEIFTREIEENGSLVRKEVESPVFITPLCRDIRQLVESHSEVLAVFDRDLGNDMKDIFLEYRPDFLGEHEGAKPFYSRLERQAEVRRRLNSKRDHHGHVHIQALVGYYADSASNPAGTNAIQEQTEIKQRVSASPLLSAMKILSHCYYRDLRNVIQNDSLWK